MLGQPLAARRSRNAWSTRPGQHEVVGPEAVRREPLVRRVLVVDLGQDDQPEAIGDLRDPVEELVDLRLDHEAGRAGLLDHVPDGVEPDDPDAVLGEEPRAIRRSATASPARCTSRSICSDQSAVPNDVQTRSCSPGRLDRHGRERRLGLAQEDPRDVGIGGDRRPGQTLSSVMNRSADGDAGPGARSPGTRGSGGRCG